MKTKELIARLQEQDPTGELECVIGNEDIYYCDRLPYYYDGTPVYLVHDETKRPYYSIVGLYVPASGEKISIRTMGVEDVFLDNPDAIVTYETQDALTRRGPWIEEKRAEIRAIIAKVDADIEQKRQACGCIGVGHQRWCRDGHGELPTRVWLQFAQSGDDTDKVIFYVEEHQPNPLAHEYVLVRKK